MLTARDVSCHLQARKVGKALLADSDLICHLQGPKADASSAAQFKPAKGPAAGAGASQALPPQHPLRGKHQRQPSALDLVHASSSSSTLLQVAADGAVGDELGAAGKQGGGAKLESGLLSEPCWCMSIGSGQPCL